MKYDFDTIIDRKNTDSIKYDFAAERGKPAGLLPLWVADMDFRSPPCVIRALEEKSRHGIFGYSESGAEYFKAVQNWFYENFGWKTERSWLIKTPGVVCAISAAIRALTHEAEAVLIQEPVYYPFAETIRVNRRKLVVNQLHYEGGAYTVDFDDFENEIIKNNVRLFILCSPHNPVGRVWAKEELTRMGDICLRHGVIIVSDEIHADFVFPGHTHSVFAALDPAFAENTVTCTAPSKSFNLAGLQISNIFIQNRIIREKFKDEINKSGYSQLNIMGITACQAAYAEGREWLDALKDYLARNLAFLKGFLLERIPQIRLVEPQGTYLIWLDCTSLGLPGKKLDDLIVHNAGLWLDDGAMFGAGGEGFQRINIACPRSVLEQALVRLEYAVKEAVKE